MQMNIPKNLKEMPLYKSALRQKLEDLRAKIHSVRASVEVNVKSVNK